MSKRKLVTDKRFELLDDFQSFCAYYFSDIVTVPFAHFHVQMVEELQASRAAFVVCQWARGLSKTTVARMAMIYLICRQQLYFGIVVSSSRQKADRLLDEFRYELSQNTRLREDFGIELIKGHNRKGDFAFSMFSGIYSVVLRAYGKGQNPRGEMYTGRRPDFFVIDDIDEDTECRNPRRVRTSFEWVMQSLYLSGNPAKSRLVALNNIIAKESIIQRLGRVADAEVSRINILDDYGDPSWAKYKKEDIELMIKRLGYNSSQQEYFNNPIVSGNLFKTEQISWEEPPDLQSLQAYIDPSWSETGDYKAVAICGLLGERYWVLDFFCRKCSMRELVAWCYQQQAVWKVPSWKMEGNFYQRTLLKPFHDRGMEIGLPLPISADNRRKENKLLRISQLTPLFEESQIAWNVNRRGSPDMEVALEQLLAFERGSTAHDDAPDALEGAISLLMHYSRRQIKPVYTKRTNQGF